MLFVEPERGWDLAPVSPTITGPERQLVEAEAQALGSSSSPLLLSQRRTRTVNSSAVISWAQALVA